MLKYGKYISGIIIGLATFIFSCTNSNSALSEHEIVSEVFESKEISDLQEILDFFTLEICDSEGGNTSNPQECFDKLQIRLNQESPSSGSIELQINFEEQKKLYNLSVFNDIWILDAYGLQLNNNGKYSKYIEKLGEKHESINQYFVDLQRVGVLSASMTASLLLFPEKFTTSDVGVRLLIAIHYLTLNDQFKRKIEN